MRRRKSNAERELAALAEKVQAARSDLEARRTAEQKAEAEHRQALDILAGDLGLDTIDEAAYERGKADADATLAQARGERERAEAVERAVSGRAADLAEQVWRAKVEAAASDERRAAEAVEEAESELVRLRGEEVLASDRLATMRRQALDARAGYDPAATAEAANRAMRDRRRAAWFAKNPAAADQAESWLAPMIAEERERWQAEDADYRERLRARPDYVGTLADEQGGLAETDAFPLIEPIGPSRR